MLVTVEEAKEYVVKNGPLVMGQGSWTATEEHDGSQNWVTCGDHNQKEGIAMDYLEYYKKAPAWAENLDFVDEEHG